MVILENNKILNFKCQNFNWKCFIFDPLPRDRKPFFKILPDFRHRSDQIYHTWKSPLGDPLIILTRYLLTSSVYIISTKYTSIAFSVYMCITYRKNLYFRKLLQLVRIFMIMDYFLGFHFTIVYVSLQMLKLTTRQLWLLYCISFLSEEIRIHWANTLSGFSRLATCRSFKYRP